MQHTAHGVDTRGARLSYVALAFVLAFGYDRLFWEHELGLNYLLFVAGGSIAFIALAAAWRHLRSPRFLPLFAGSVVLAITPVLYNNELVAGLIPPLAVFLALLAGLLSTIENPHRYAFRFSQIPFLGSVDKPIITCAQVARDLFVWKRESKTDIVRKVLLGIAISLPIVLLFGWLFYQADDIFAEWVRNLIHIEITLELVWRIVRTIVVTAFVSGLLYVFVQDNVLGHKEKRVRAFDTMIVSIVLALVNILFAAFVFIQIKYLFGSAEFVLENGLTFAEYARKGFFELVWIMIFAALLILVIYRAFAHHTRASLPAALQVLLIIQVGVIAASALKRMNLYQDVFGYTVLRLYVEWFMYFVLVVLAGSTIAILTNWSFRHFFHAGLGVSLAALTLVSLVNVDFMIAQENVERFLSGKSIDMQYITHELSIDAVPAVAALLTPESLEKLSIPDRIALATLQEDATEKAEARDRWFEWNRAVVLANHVLEKRSATADVMLERAKQKDEAFYGVRSALQTKRVYSGYQGGCDTQELFSDMADKDLSCVRVTKNGTTFSIGLATPVRYEWKNSEDTEAKGEVILRIRRHVFEPVQRSEQVLERRFAVTPSMLDPKTFEYDPYAESWQFSNESRYTQEYALLDDGRILESNWDMREHALYELLWNGAQAELKRMDLKSGDDLPVL